MLSHDRIWAAIDQLAERYGMSASGLARKAGLDATSFNRSKRKGPDGRDRWPSTESVAKILAATGPGLDEFKFPDFSSEKVFAVEVSGDSMLPLYRDGDVLIVSTTASVRKGDRVVVRTNDGEVMAKEVKRRTAKSVELLSLNPEHEDRVLSLRDLAWMARVMWARQ